MCELVYCAEAAYARDLEEMAEYGEGEAPYASLFASSLTAINDGPASSGIGRSKLPPFKGWGDF